MKVVYPQVEFYSFKATIKKNAAYKQSKHNNIGRYSSYPHGLRSGKSAQYKKKKKKKLI
jgi:hypothetical protein